MQDICVSGTVQLLSLDDGNNICNCCPRPALTSISVNKSSLRNIENFQHIGGLKIILIIYLIIIVQNESQSKQFILLIYLRTEML